MWFSNLKAERLYRRGTVLLAAGLLVVSMAACGSGKGSGTSNGKVNTKTEQPAQKSKNGTSSIPKNTSGVNPGQISQPKTEGNNNQSVKQPKAGTVNVEPETKSSQKSGLKDDTIPKSGLKDDTIQKKSKSTQ